MNLKHLSIRGISYSLSRSLASYRKESHIQKYKYYYSLQILIGSIFKGIVIFGLSYVLGILKEAIIVSLVFGSIRIFAGGYHADNYAKCLVETLIIVLSVSFISKYAYGYYSTIANTLIFTAIFLMIHKYAPLENINKPIISDKFRKTQKTKAYLATLFWFVISLYFLITTKSSLSISIGLAAFIEGLALTPAFAKTSLRIEKFCAIIYAH